MKNSGVKFKYWKSFLLKDCKKMNAYKNVSCDSCKSDDNDSFEPDDTKMKNLLGSDSSD